MSLFQNTCKPQGLGGKFMLLSMNMGHAAMAKWGLSHIKVEPTQKVLDAGCGGGANVKNLLTMAAHVTGIDYSPVSVEKSRKVNRRAISEGRCRILQANVLELPFEEGEFDLVTAFETVYFWPEIIRSFGSVYRVLKPGGQFLICNEADGEHEKDNKWVEKIQGMTIYNGRQLQDLLEKAGFHDVHVVKNGGDWMTVTARK